MQPPGNLPIDVLLKVPDSLPIPEDDGACSHLPGKHLPSVALQATSGQRVNLADLPGYLVVYCYPMTGRPGVPIPNGWTSIPGAAGCTPQSCAFRDSHDKIRALGASVYGISAQAEEDQSEAAARLGLPYVLLSDSALEFADTLGLPTFAAEGRRLIKRVTLIAHAGKVVKYFYPVFPPDQNANEVMKWLNTVKNSPDI